ncbi:hypothetical protein JL108_14460 [Aeromicrobium sp. YIM 150415]|uniref:hypothetical protein n=1 Tax=Aeromicrobium sp. YIM 150415 TaxID=2803912 RepID=UPI00196472DC|nr:hypothetical protein [Aeromicrobium sp. YIM 150415]MBM9464656.1 hypothetical protein [Aeromicrobium sp. YIM 150415]
MDWSAVIPEAVGAFLGASLAGVIAWRIARSQIAAEKTRTIENERRAAFGAFLGAVHAFNDVIRTDEGDMEQLRAAHLEIVRAQQVWSMYLLPSDGDLGDWVFSIVSRLADLAMEVFRRNEHPVDRLLDFFSDGSESLELVNGIFTYGVDLHREGGDVSGARDWFMKKSAVAIEDLKPSRLKKTGS